MSFTQAQIDAMKSAYAQGIASVTHNGKTVTYASLSALWQAIKNMEAEVSPPSKTTRPNLRKIRFREIL